MLLTIQHFIGYVKRTNQRMPVWQKRIRIIIIGIWRKFRVGEKTQCLTFIYFRWLNN